MSAARVLVAGGTGFIGRRLVGELLRRGEKLRILTRDAAAVARRWPDTAIEAVEGDLTLGTGLERACRGINSIFHLAGYAHAEDAGTGGDELHRRTTVEGTRALLDAAVANGIRRFVFLSSVKAMGEETTACLDETAQTRPVTPYGKAKLEAERLVLETAARHGMHGSVLRLPLVYGPGSKGNLAKMAEAIRRRRFPPLPRTANRRSMVHVDDVVQALLLAADKAAANGQVYIVTDGQTYSARQIYDWICEALGRTVPRWSVPYWVLHLAALGGDAVGRISGRSFAFNSERLAKLLGSAWYSSEKVARELGYRPRFSLRESIAQMIARNSGSASN